MLLSHVSATAMMKTDTPSTTMTTPTAAMLRVCWPTTWEPTHSASRGQPVQTG